MISSENHDILSEKLENHVNLYIITWVIVIVKKNLIEENRQNLAEIPICRNMKNDTKAAQSSRSTPWQNRISYDTLEL